MVLGSTLDTRRMRGEPIGPQHRDGLMALLGDPRVGETLGGAATPADVDAQIAWVRRRWAEHGFGWYAFLDRGSGALVARAGRRRRTSRAVPRSRSVGPSTPTAG